MFLSVQYEDVPRIAASDRRSVHELGSGIHQVVLRYGYMQTPRVPRDLAVTEVAGEAVEGPETSYFLGRYTLQAGRMHGMAAWRERLYIAMSHNARGAPSFFNIPPDRVVELGIQVQPE